MLTHSLTEGIGRPYLALDPQLPGQLLPRAAAFVSFPSHLLSLKRYHFNTLHPTWQNKTSLDLTYHDFPPHSTSCAFGLHLYIFVVSSINSTFS